MDTSLLRLFFAVQLPTHTQRALDILLEQLHQQEWAKKIRWIAPPNLHITLRFIGECPAEKLPALMENVATAIQNIGPFQLQLKTLELFPGKRHPRVLIVAVEMHSTLVKLAQTLESAVTSMELPAERRVFVPHLSLGRIMQHVEFSELILPEFNSTQFEVNHFVLIQSDHARNKKNYSVLEKFDLT